MSESLSLEQNPAGRRVRLDRNAFNRPTLEAARSFLGKFIVRNHQGRRISAAITEVEAYKGPRDRAAHTHGGRRTPRVEPLYGNGGTVYVYLVYGLHWLLNFSTAGHGVPEGVLIRGIFAGTAAGGTLIAGPGKVCRHLAIDKTLDGTDAVVSSDLWLEDHGARVAARRIRSGPRVGVDYAGPYWAARPWRFSIDAETIRAALAAR